MCLLDLNLSQLYSHIFWYYNFPGESDDDREELLVAANAAHNARSMPLDFIYFFFSNFIHSPEKQQFYYYLYLLQNIAYFCRSCLFWFILEENGIYFCFCQLRGFVLLEAAGSY